MPMWRTGKVGSTAKGKERGEATPETKTACVFFTVPERRLGEMDVETGPCVPVAGRRRSLVSSIAKTAGSFRRKRLPCSRF